MARMIERDSAVAAAALRSAVRGEVVVDGDAEYDVARGVYLRGIDRRPLAIVRPADADDVARVVVHAAETGLPLAVRSGGHSPAGHGTVDGGLVLDLRQLRQLDVDIAGRAAWAGTGMRAGEYTRTVGEHGLTTGFGDTASVGLGGITLAGGVGFLHRRHGLTIDNVLAAEVITADGRRLHADEETNADLFWAIRGGGGNFGVVTRFRYRLLDVDHVYGGLLILPATATTIASFINLAAAAPDGLSGMINVTIAPPLPFLPPAIHGQPIIMSVMVFDGAEAEGASAFAPFRALATPLLDQVAPIRYAQIYDGPEPPQPASMTVRSSYTDEIDEAAADAILDALQRSTAPMRVAQFRALGGAVARVAADATAFAHRGRRFMMTIAAASFDVGHDAGQHAEWANALAVSVRRGEPGAYVGFLSDAGGARVHEAYHGPNWDRLRRIKARYDPTNLFRLNANVSPAVE